MKKKITFLSLVLFVAAISFAFYNGTKDDKKGDKEIKWGNFENGTKTAKSSSKKIIVDVYTDWCSWCKKMDKTTYGNDEVINYISKNFVAVRLNAESKNKTSYLGQSYTEQQLAQGFGITGFPSTIFFDENQNPITVVPGYIEGQDFMNVLKFINEDIYKTKNFEDYMKSVKK
jgi:thioredoxin-related protein